MAGKNLPNIGILILGISIHAALFGTNYAQTQFEIDQSVIYDENVFRNYLEIPDWITQTTAFISHSIPINNSQLRSRYSGNINTFNDFKDRLFHIHDLGFSAVMPIYESLALHAGTSFQIRKNQTEYNIYDYANWLLNGDLIFNKWRSSFFQIGYHFRKKDFQNLPQFNFEENFVYLRTRLFLPTRTTILGQVNMATKNYTENQTIEELIITDKVKPHQGTGQGRRRGDVPIVSDTAIVANNLSIPETQQWSLQIKLAQSVFRTTGASLDYIRRFEPTQGTRYLSGQEYAYTKDDELFDDPFTYASHEWYFTVTQILPGDFTLKLNASLADKQYIYSAQTDSLVQSGIVEKRKDTQFYLGFSLDKNFSLSWFIHEMNIYFSYFYLINESNDPYFDSRGKMISFGTSFKL